MFRVNKSEVRREGNAVETELCRNIRSLAIVCSLLLISACATVKPEGAVNQKAGEITQDTTRKAAGETGEVIRTTTGRTEAALPGVQNSTTTQVSAANSVGQQNITARIIQKAKRVKIKSGASNKSRTIARLAGGKQIEILEEKGSWLKIRWQNGEKVREGWSRKQYVDMTP